jgi:hypothetical protein
MSGKTISGRWDSYWETTVKTEPEWIQENIEITQKAPFTSHRMETQPVMTGLPADAFTRITFSRFHTE